MRPLLVSAVSAAVTEQVQPSQAAPAVPRSCCKQCLFELLQRAARVRSSAQATTRAAQVSCTGCTPLAHLRLLLASVFRPLAQYLKIGVHA